MAILLASLPCFSSPSWTPVPFPSRVRGFPCYSLLPLRPPQLLHELLPFCQQNSDERCKFAKRLLLMIRLHLISDRSLQNNLDKLSVFTDNKECATILNNDFFKNKTPFYGKLISYHKGRYCKQNMNAKQIRIGFQSSWK